MNQLEYIPGIGGQKSIPMDGPSAFVGTADGLRSRKWQYDLGYRGLLNATRPAREVDVDFVSDYATADALRRVADADVAARTPGVFVAQNEWRQNAYIVESEPTNIHYGWLSTTLKALLLDGAWWRIVSKSFRPENTSIDKQYIVKTGFNSVSAAGAADAALNALTVYGKAVQASKPKNGASVPIDVVKAIEPFENVEWQQGSINTTGSIPSTDAANRIRTVNVEITTGVTYKISLPDMTNWQFVCRAYSGESRIAANYVSADSSATWESAEKTWTPSTATYLSIVVRKSDDSNITPSVAPAVSVDGGIQLNVDGANTRIDLDGNVLASLPDGTQDVLKINSAGAVTIEKRVGVVDLSTPSWAMPTGSVYYYKALVDNLKSTAVVGKNPNLLAEKFAQTPSNNMFQQGGANAGTYTVTSYPSNQTKSFLYVKTDGGQGTYVTPTGLCYYPLIEPQEVTLGSIAMPTLTNYSTIELVASMGATITVKYETSPSVFLDYPHDYEYDYLARSAAASVETSVLTECDVRLVIYGQCDNPYVVIGGNRYQVNCGVPAGAYLTIDGREKTIILTLEDGTTVNVFGDGVRGSGLGSGEYVFEPIKPGAQNVEWDGSFGFDLGWYEEEGEPPWSQS